MRWFVRAVSLLALFSLSRPAHADAPACTDVDLLANRFPIRSYDVVRNLRHVTDEKEPVEGAPWDAPPAVILTTRAGTLTYDLGDTMEVTAFHLQADANDTYRISGSLDGEHFTTLIDVEAVSGDGLRSRNVEIQPHQVRYLRVGEAFGDDFFSIAEFAAYCQKPALWPPRFERLAVQFTRPAPPPWWKLAWDNDVSARWEMVLALLGLALLGAGVGLRRRWRDGLLGILGILSLGAYFNYGSFHFNNYIHWWDTFHYYIGSKYFNELSYERLYDCVAVADYEVPYLRPRVEKRKLTDLRTNELKDTRDILSHPEQCKEHFTPERWKSFSEDIAYFRARAGSRWEDVSTDHGFNATPVWTLAGATLSNLGPATDRQIQTLTAIDLGYFGLMLVMIGWAFGWRALCVALLVIASNFPSRYYWTGGSYLRWDWLFSLVCGVCLLRREKWLLAGIFLAWSTMLRIFPGFVMVGPLMLVAQQLLEQRRLKQPFKLEKKWLQLFGGALLAIAVLLPLSLAREGGPRVLGEFARNTKKHASTPLTNYMGWRTVVAWDPRDNGMHARSNRLYDPWSAWKAARLHRFHQRVVIYGLGLLGVFWLLWYAVRDREPWVAAALASSLIAFIPELTCYYYAFMIVPALLWVRDRTSGLILLGVTALGGLVAWAPTAALRTRWLQLLPTWDDDKYTLMSAITLAGFIWILARFAQRQDQPPVDEAAPTPPSR